MYGPIGAWRRKPTPSNRWARTERQIICSALVELVRNARARLRACSVTRQVGLFTTSSVTGGDEAAGPLPTLPRKRGRGMIYELNPPASVGKSSGRKP